MDYRNPNVMSYIVECHVCHDPLRCEINGRPEMSGLDDFRALLFVLRTYAMCAFSVTPFVQSLVVDSTASIPARYEWFIRNPLLLSGWIGIAAIDIALLAITIYLVRRRAQYLSRFPQRRLISSIIVCIITFAIFPVSPMLHIIFSTGFLVWYAKMHHIICTRMNKTLPWDVKRLTSDEHTHALSRLNESREARRVALAMAEIQNHHHAYIAHDLMWM